MHLLLDRVHDLLSHYEPDAGAIVRRLRIVSPGERPVPRFCELIGRVLMKWCRMSMPCFAQHPMPVITEETI